MTPEAIKRAASLIWEKWDAAELMDELPEECCPQTDQDAHAIQSSFPIVSGIPHAGWKIAATSQAGQKHIQVDGPLAGRLLSKRILENGAVCSLLGNTMGVMEAEFAFRFGELIPPRTRDYTSEEVLSRVSELCLTIEIPDSRFQGLNGKIQLLAECACAWWLVKSDPVQVNWRDLDLKSHQVHVSKNGVEVAEGTGANVLGDPREALNWLVNDVGSRGVSIGAGELVTTGTCVVPVTIQPGDEIIADFGVLGIVKARFE
mgnify:CR=1 FL=1